jgi:PAS domain S-box-containing protein
VSTPDSTRTHLAAIVDSADDAIVSKTLDSVITSWNRGAERLFGWTSAEAVGQSILLIIPDDRHHEEEAVLARIRMGQRVEHFDTVRRTRDGRFVEVSITVSPIFDDAGRVVGASKIARDITARRQSEIVQARLAALVDSSDDAIVSKTLDGVITSWNPAAERMFGWTAAEAVGQSILLIIPEDRRYEEEAVLARIRAGQRVDHFDTVRRTKDGRLLEVSITVSPIADAAGHIVGASKIARDITDRRRIEDATARLLASEQDARRQAEALNRTKDELLATVSHELRTPLNSIFGWARMLQSTHMNEAARTRAINAIVRSASAQARLIEDLVDLSRIVTGQMRLDFEPMDLNAVIEAAIDSVRPAADAKGIVLATALDRSIGLMEGAPDRLQQVMWNLVMNSVKFTPRGGRIDVAVRRGDGTVDMVVSDTGEGIAPEVLLHVFEPFRQEDSSSTRAHGGLGLGLTLVRQLVEHHGGTVRADSPGKGRGATFTVTLPLTAPRLDSRRRSALRPGSPLATLEGVRVLVVDDDAESLDMAATMLRDAGADVRTASSAFRAQELIDSWRPGVVLTDLAMPGEDGFALLLAMRTAFAGRGEVPVIAITAYGSPERQARALEAGFDRYLTKPIDPLELTSAVAAAARRAS